MKRWKYLLGTAILLCLVVTLMALPVFGAEIVETGSCGGSATYTLDADGVLTISGSGSVDSDAFEENDAIKKVVVEPGITSIGEYAFYRCAYLTSVTLPEGLTSIGSYAFSGCALSSVTLPEGLTSIGSATFSGCDSLSSVTLPEGLTSIGSSAFSGCDSLSSVTLPEGLTSIGGSAFNGCARLISVTLPEGLTSIGQYAFENCDSLSSVTLPEGLTSIGGSAFNGCASLTSVTLPEGLTSIGWDAFRYCDSLSSVTLPEGLTSIGWGAFECCYSLTSMTLPESLTSIGGDAFGYCDALDQLIFLGDLPSIGENAFMDTSPTVYYVEGNATWDDDGMQKYGGTPTYKPLGSPVELVVTAADPYPYYLTGDRVEKRDVDATLVYDSGARSLLHPSKFELTGGELASPGAKALTVTAQGVRAFVTIYVHNGDVVEVDPAEWPESRHNYKNNTDDTQVLTAPGADQIRITFSDRTHMESGYDDLYVYDGDGSQVAAYTGSEAAGKTLTVQGDTVQIRLVTDGSGTDWGYALSHVEALWVEHLYDAKGNCTICGSVDPDAVTQPTLTLKYPSLSFEAEVLYNVYYIAENTDDVVEMGLLTFDSEVADGSIDNATDMIPGFETDGSIWKVGTNGISAKNLGDDLYFMVYAELSDGSYAYSAMKSYSAVSYANTILGRSTSTDYMKSLVVSMLNYGTEAQLYFEHRTDSLMNASLTAEQQALVSAYDESMMDSVVAVDSTKAQNFIYDGSSFARRDPSVSFDGAFSINYYFTAANAPDDGMTLYYWNIADYLAADVLTVDNATGSMEMVATETENQYWGNVAGIAAKDLDQTVFVVGVYEYNGTTYTTGVLNYSIGKYCEGIAANSASNQQAFAQATAVYGYCAKGYFTNL